MSGAQWWLMLDKAGFQMAWLLLSALWQSSILLLAAGVLAYALRRRRASVRHAVLAGAILCSPLIPLLGLAASRSGTPQAPIPVMPAYSTPVVDAYPAPVAPTCSVPAPPALPARPAGPVLTEAPAGAEIDRAPALPAVTGQPQEAPLALLDCPWALALLAYAAGAGGLLCLVAVGKYRIGRWAHRGRVVTDPRVLEIFQDARRRLGLARDFTVVENERILSPMTVGTLHPVILMPAGLAEDSSDDDLQAVALHELKHVQRCDSLLLTLLSLVRTALFFHPLVHLACRQASALAENACDDAVLEATNKPVPYAKMLARLAEQLPRHAFATELAAGIVWSKSSFLRRVEAILSDRRDEIRTLSRAAIILTVVGVVVSVAVAAALPLGEKSEGQAAANSADTQPTSPQPASAQSVPRAPSLELKWQKDLSHQFEAGDCFVRDGHLYVGSGKVPARIIKLRLTDGQALWTHEVENASYQPSYPVSNGKVVVLGTYSRPRRIVGLDDRTGKQLWAVPTEEQNMSAACFAGNVAFIGSYDRHLYAIDTAKGRLLWKKQLGMRIWSRPAIVGDLVLVGCYDGFLYALKQADGEIAWKVACGGRIGGDVVVANNLALVRMDDQTADQPYKTDRAGKIIVAVDIAKHELAGKWKARQSWNRRILLDGDDAYFFETGRLCSLDLKTCKLNWEYIASPADPVLAAPVLLKDHILLPLNVMDKEGEHRRQKVLLSKANGKIVARGESGGVGSRWNARYVQTDGLVALTSPLQAYRIEAGDKRPPATQPALAEVIKGNPRVLIHGSTITLRWDAKDDDLAQLGDGKGIVAIHYGGWPSGGPTPRITDKGLAHLARWKDLKEVVWMADTTDNWGRAVPHITEAGLKHLSGLKNLQKLVLTGQKITDTGMSHLAGLTNLQELLLDFIPALTDAGLAHLRELTNLKVLRLYGAAVTDSGVANLSKMTQLEDLQLGRSRVSDKGMETIGGLKKLKTLDLQHALISDKGLRQIEGLTQLTWLCLNDTSVSDDGLKHLKGLSRLEWLYLEGTKVTGEGLKSLKALTNLRVLYLDNTAVGDDGIVTLVSMAALERLKLNRTKVTDAGLLKLASSKTLKELEIEQTPISAEGLARFRQAAPNMSVKPEHIPPPPTPLTPAQLDHLESQSYDFMKRSVLLRLKRWRESQPKTAAELEKYATEIVINLDQPEVLLKDGTDRVLRSGLSSSFAWTVYRVTPEGAQLLKAPVRLKLPGLASQPNTCKEVFVLQGKLESGRGVFAEITTNGLRFNAGKGVANLAGYQFPKEQYVPTPDSINQSLLIGRPVVTAPAAMRPAKNLIWGETVDGIRCAVRPAKSSFAPDEDIVVDVVYSNVSEGPITVCVFPDPLYTWVALRIRDDKGASMTAGAHGTGTRPPLKKSDFVTLLPGRTASFRQVIRYNPKAPVEPGQYIIQAKINKINRMDKQGNRI